MGLDQTTEFLVVAATLLDLKAARLLPAGQVEDAEDLALLEARDLLFARLLQYRAYKQVAALFGELEEAALRRYPRSVAVEDQFTELLPRCCWASTLSVLRRSRRLCSHHVRCRRWASITSMCPISRYPSRPSEFSSCCASEA